MRSCPQENGWLKDSCITEIPPQPGWKLIKTGALELSLYNLEVDHPIGESLAALKACIP